MAVLAQTNAFGAFVIDAQICANRPFQVHGAAVEFPRLIWRSVSSAKKRMTRTSQLAVEVRAFSAPR